MLHAVQCQPAIYSKLMNSKQLACLQGTTEACMLSRHKQSLPLKLSELSSLSLKTFMALSWKGSNGWLNTIQQCCCTSTKRQVGPCAFTCSSAFACADPFAMYCECCNHTMCSNQLHAIAAKALLQSMSPCDTLPTS